MPQSTTTTEIEVFDQIDDALRANGAAAVFDLLGERFRAEKNYPALFESRLMKARFELGLPLVHTDALREKPEPTQLAYDQASLAAAREVGNLFLADGEIVRGWPYFRAIGEPAPVAEVIERLAPAEDMDAIIEIAFHEGVNPRKGFELILANHGICRAITCFGQYPAKEGRQECGRLLVETVHRELRVNIKRTIAANEESAPETDSLVELIEGRDWLFEGSSYYLDTSHVASVIQMSPELEDEATLALAVELTEYGRNLSSMYHYPGQSPFENLYEDYGLYLKAMIGRDVEAAIAHFQAKIDSADLEAVNWAPAQALILLLVRLNRLDAAVSVARRHLSNVDPRILICPTATQLCQTAEDFEQLKQVAREKIDVLNYAAGAIQS